MEIPLSVLPEWRWWVKSSRIQIQVSDILHTQCLPQLQVPSWFHTSSWWPWWGSPSFFWNSRSVSLPAWVQLLSGELAPSSKVSTVSLDLFFSSQISTLLCHICPICTHLWVHLSGCEDPGNSFKEWGQYSEWYLHATLSSYSILSSHHPPALASMSFLLQNRPLWGDWRDRKWSKISGLMMR